MIIRNLLAAGALVAALVIPGVASAQAVIRRGPHRTVVVRRPHRVVHRRPVIVRRPVHRHHRTVVVRPRRTVIVHH